MNCLGRIFTKPVAVLGRVFLLVLALGLSVLVAPSLASAAGLPQATMVAGFPPANGMLKATQTLEAKGTTGTASVHFFLFGSNNVGSPEIAVAPIMSTSGVWPANWDTTKVHNGSYSVVAVAYNSSGNPGAPSAAVSFTVNNPLQTTTVTNPTSGKPVTGTAVTLQATASTGTANVVFYLFGGGEFGALIASGTFSTTLGWSGCLGLHQ